MTETMDHTTTVGVEAKLSVLPLEFQHALKFARAHGLLGMLGYVEDENEVCLATVPPEIEE